ncbi:MAG: TetR/AcrR family transcriptional regulator [Acidimicrobiales bacterium]|nr:MAG: TetR/AcrR family transcriptional regulator [Acidimicrobiales bacterium]
MGRPKKERGGKPVLTLDHIVETALGMADEQGIAQLSMRKLATELGAGVMSLYYYVADKDTLVEALVDRVASEVELETTGDWTAAARQLAVATHEALLRHPWAIPEWSTVWPGPYRFALTEQLLEVLAGAQLPPDVADLGFHALTNHIQGFARQRVAYGDTQTDTEEMRNRVQGLLTQGDYPRVAEHVRYHVEGHGNHDEFGYVLDLILDGLARSKADCQQ